MYITWLHCIHRQYNILVIFTGRNTSVYVRTTCMSHDSTCTWHLICGYLIFSVCLVWSFFGANFHLLFAHGNDAGVRIMISCWGSLLMWQFIIRFRFEWCNNNSFCVHFVHLLNNMCLDVICPLWKVIFILYLENISFKHISFNIILNLNLVYYAQIMPENKFIWNLYNVKVQAFIFSGLKVSEISDIRARNNPCV